MLCTPCRAVGNRTKLTHADGYFVDYTFDVLGRMTSVTEDGAATPLADYTYDTLGRRTDLERRNGADTSYAFDLANRLTALDHTFVGSTALEHDYGYNAVSQVTSVTLSNDDYLWQPTDNGTINATVDEMNELDVYNANTITYDGNGNMTSDGSQTYIYNKSNQMIGAFVDATTISYLYDPAGRRVKKDVGGIVTEYLLDGAHEIVEYSGTGTILRRFIYGPGVDEPIAMVEGGATTFYHQNHQGTVVAISDATGAVTQKYTYDAYGASSDTTLGQPFRYTGRRLDPETGLFYYRARYYSPAMGRFMQVDPIRYAAGMNTHAYVGNDPMNFNDPSGMIKGIPDETVWTYTDDSKSTRMTRNSILQNDPFTQSIIFETNEERSERREVYGGRNIISALWSGVTAIGNSGAVNMVIGFLNNVYVAATYWTWEGRDDLNGVHNYADIIAGRAGRPQLVSESETMLHDNDNGDGFPEKKFIYSNGEEAVFDGRPPHDPMTGSLRGSYNYVVPMPFSEVYNLDTGEFNPWNFPEYAVRGIGHVGVDVIPFIVGGLNRGPG